MLRLRLISSFFGLLLLIAVIYFGHIGLGVATFILALIGMNEFYNAVSKKGAKPIRIIGYTMCLPLLFMGFDGYFEIINSLNRMIVIFQLSFLLIFVCVVWLFLNIIFKHNKYDLNDIALTILGMFYVVFLFCFIPLVRNMNQGHIYIWLVFIGAFGTDTFAYFSGRFFGKTKLLPEISPKKTVEGAIGGTIGCIVTTVAYGIFVNQYFQNVDIPLIHFCMIGFLCGIVSQIGDWSASAVKRYVDVKDYGTIMPGHGGVLDRVDSVLFVAPVVFFYVGFFIK